MKDTDRSKPATKGDLIDGLTALKDELGGSINSVEQKLNGKIDSVEQKLNGKIDSVEQNLNGKIDSVEQNLNGKIDSVEQNLNGKIYSVEQKLTGEINSVAARVDRLAIELAKTQADVREIKYDLATNVSTKDDISRVLNAIDKFAATTENYKRKDLERGDMLMAQHDKLQNHETRLTLLEAGK
ncbi:MAG: hypothetical protein A2X28_01785 [Elusimicrobia bacterium GWA2_56_46]|nr:MAG: hypothetical protein A2X28_01785 [Elusimicrobia bacterium GWA2_56_46]